MNIIRVDGLTKRYGDFTAVDHVSFTVERGTMLAYLGVNGAGKTTVINMLATLLSPDGGSAEGAAKVWGRRMIKYEEK
ncbi:MAG: ATP-binding cassette domain-containing protein [Lachnospiraceae bacterium]|nr:ATP-binding cassette domain-containing protein [Lachnospiraceae bacterium]